MLAPIDKITKPHGNRIVQIVLTNSCDVYKCSSCTQLLPFRKDRRFMSLECVEEALAASADWPGVLSAFGGNPCTHAQFPEICRLFQKYIPDQRRRGLWTNNLLQHGEIIRETFWPHGTFNLNVHTNEKAAAEMEKWLPGIPIWGRKPVSHGGVLGNYKDLGVSDSEWVAKRERCPINQNWSSGIYERDGHPYAYFCEVAGSIDGVTGENNGVRVEPGWWRWAMDKFQHQVGACCDKHCIVPLQLKGHLDTEDTYDITPSVVPLTENMRGRVKLDIHQSVGETTHELTDYVGLRKPGRR